MNETVFPFAFNDIFDLPPRLAERQGENAGCGGRERGSAPGLQRRCWATLAGDRVYGQQQLGRAIAETRVQRWR